MIDVEEKIDLTDHDKHGPHPADPKVVKRLKNIEGQIRGILRMVEEEKYCVDIMNQISAARAALNSVGMVILRRHVETCVTNAIEEGGKEKAQIIDELMHVISKNEI
jgi:DNA-binding FrmR family transcriptional regulator